MAVPSAAAATQGTTINLTTGGDTDEIGEITSFRGLGGGQANLIRTTHLKSTGQEKRMGLKDEGQFSCEGNLVPSDEGQRRVWAGRSAGTKQTIAIVMTDTPTTTLTFECFIMAFEITGQGDDVYRFNMTSEITGAINGFPAPT